MTYSIPRPESSPTPSQMPKPMCEQPSFSMTSNDHFFDSLHYIFIFSFTILCLYGLHKPRHFYGLSLLELCLTIIDGSFTLGGIYPNLLIPRAYCLLLFSYSVQLIWTLSHYPSPPNPTPNVLLINNRVPMTHHRTPNTMSISTIHSHPPNAIMPLQLLMLHV